PFTVSLGESKYPSLDEILAKLNMISNKVITLNAIQIAEEAGSSKVANIVMLGVLFGIGQLPIKIETIKDTIQARFPAKLASVNIKAFDLGYETASTLLSKP
ncbi:unnamed protein product, partial [marine sediment metagenome]